MTVPNKTRPTSSITTAQIAFHLCALAGFLLISTPTFAGDFSRTGFYGSIGGVYSVDLYEDDVEEAIGHNVLVDIEEAGGVSARVGLRFLRALAVELHYEWIDEYDIDLRSTTLPARSTLSLDQHTLTANAKLYMPIWRIQPYILAGVGFQQLKLSGPVQLGSLSLQQKGTDLVLAGRVGGGLEVYLTEHIALFGEGLVVLTEQEIELQNGNRVDNLFYAGGSAGLVYRF